MALLAVQVWAKVYASALALWNEKVTQDFDLSAAEGLFAKLAVKIPVVQFEGPFQQGFC